MINAFYSATSGAISSQSNIDISANNIANVNTTGYKEQRASFSEILYSNMAAGDGTTTANIKAGNGVKLQGVSKIFNQGDVIDTGSPFDVAIEGNGFFGVMDASGNISYTRAGNFRSSNENGANYLVTASGDYVLDNNNQPIILSEPIKDVIFSSQTTTPSINDGTIKLGVFSFNNPYELTEIGDNKYAVNSLSGGATLDTMSRIKQGSLEASTVDLTTEMTKIIEAQRAFQFNSKLLQVADEVEQMANTLRT